MRARRLAALLLCAVAACGEEDRTQTSFTPSNNRASVSTDDTAAIPAPATRSGRDTVFQPATMRSAAFSLNALTAKPIAAAVRLLGKGEATDLTVRLSGGHPGTTYEGAIRLGSCSRIGSTVESLNPVTADSLGGGSAFTTVPLPADSIGKGGFVVVFGPGGRPEVCGAVPAGAAPSPPPPARPTPPDTAATDTT